jgi:transposase
MEHTGVYHLKLANYLYENGYKVAVVNPFSIIPMKKLKENLEYQDELIIKNRKEHKKT